MKAWMWAVLAIGAAGALFLVSPKAPTVTVDMGDLTLTARAPAELVIQGASRVDVSPTSVPVSGTSVPSVGTKWKLPAWLGSPFARATLYVLAGGAAVLVLKWVKQRWGWADKQMLNATIVVVAALGILLSVLFQDKGVSLLKNPLNIGGGIGAVYTLANLAFKFWVQR